MKQLVQPHTQRDLKKYLECSLLRVVELVAHPMLIRLGQAEERSAALGWKVAPVQTRVFPSFLWHL